MNVLPNISNLPVKMFGPEFNRWIDRFFASDLARPLSVGAYDWTPVVDIVELSTGGFMLYIDLPGVDPKNVELTIENELLTIHGVRNPLIPLESEGRRFTESVYGSFFRSFNLPVGVTSADIKASYKNGVLEVLVPAGKPVIPERIKVNA
jgi:HSP20 family protein